MPNDSWLDPAFDEDPRLVLGDRPEPKRLAGRRIDIHENVFPDLREISESAFEDLKSASPKPYDPYATLESGEEYFLIEDDDIRTAATSALPSQVTQIQPQSTFGMEPTDQHVLSHELTDLTRIVQNVDLLQPITPGEVREQGYLFYAICWPYGDGFIGFVRKTDPRRVLSKGRRFFKFDDVLKSATTPDLALDPQIDVVIVPGRIAGFSPTPVKDLFTDVGLVFGVVDQNVEMIQTTMATRVPLSDATLAALRERGHLRISVARRLHLLPNRLDAIGLTADSLRQELIDQNVDPDTLLGADGLLDFGPNEVGVFLDIVEGRYFNDPFGQEQRRADRYSVRGS